MNAMQEEFWPMGLGADSSEEQLSGACLRLAMLPAVIQDSPNAPIPIFNGSVRLTEGGHTTEESCCIRYVFVPDPDLKFEVASPSKLYGRVVDDVKLQPVGADGPTRALLLQSGATWGHDEKVAPASGLLSGSVSFGGKARIGRIRFHLLNFLDYRGDRIFRYGARQGPRSWTGRASFSMGPWQVTLDAQPDSRERLAEARKQRRHVITHVGNLERRSDDGRRHKLFGAKEAERALELLYFVFTFANGACCPCVLPFGYRHMPTEVYRAAHGGARCAPAGNNGTWFAKENPSECFAFADRLYELWKDEGERSWLSSAIHLYVEANRNLSGVDIELAKSQILLELLSWEAVQERQQLISRENFDRISAADKIRLALLWAGISSEIPSHMEELSGALAMLKEGETGPFDGPFAITQIRNATIHATRSKRKRMAGMDDLARYQAWQLSQSYVALLILRLLDYRGPYLPNYRRQSKTPSHGPFRLWLEVPWAQSQA